MYHRIDSLNEKKSSDVTKSAICKEKGITLIEIPYWWDKSIKSLYATIYNNRPDLLSVLPTGNPIPLIPPVEKLDKSLSRIKESLMLSTEWDNSTMDPTGWYMSEKYDGMRLYWNGNQFYSRNGEIVKVPSTIRDNMPSSISLDGELWTQYGLYQDAVNLVRSSNTEKWKKAIFWVFDAPNLNSIPYEVTHIFKMILTNVN